MHQTLICRLGTFPVIASDGEARGAELGDVGLGDILRMVDLAGKGNNAPVTSAEDFEAVIVQHG